MVKLFSTWFLAVETAMLQIYAKVYQNSLKKKFLCIHNANSANLVKPLPLTSFVSYRNFKALQLSDNLKPVYNGPLKLINKRTESTYTLLTEDGKYFHTHRICV